MFSDFAVFMDCARRWVEFIETSFAYFAAISSTLGWAQREDKFSLAVRKVWPLVLGIILVDLDSFEEIGRRWDEFIEAILDSFKI